MTNLTPFGKLVVKALTDKDMTKTELASQVGTSPQYLSYILFGVRSGKKYIPKIDHGLYLLGLYRPGERLHGRDEKTVRLHLRGPE